jgi:AraC-like DNA-binding protein
MMTTSPHPGASGKDKTLFDRLWQPEARLDVKGIRLEVGHINWPQPVETRICPDEHQLSLSLTPRLEHTRLGEAGLDKLKLTVGLDVKSDTLRKTLASVAQEILNPGLAGERMIEALMTTALIELARYLQGHAADRENFKGGLAPWQMRRIRERVTSVDEPPPTIEELAELCGISSRHLMRGFKKSSGMTLYSFIEEIRLERAKALLIDTDTPMKVISWQLGFTHPSNFTIAFKRAMGVTPSAYRSQCAASSKSG